MRFDRRRRLLGLIAGLAGTRAAAGGAPAHGRSEFAERAIAMRERAVAAGDQPYGAVVVRDGRIVAEAPSRVVSSVDPTAHAEMEAIRAAARVLGTRNLSGCQLYGSARACRMCEAAAVWAHIDRLYHGTEAIDDGPPRMC